MLSFKDFMTVDYTPGDAELVSMPHTKGIVVASAKKRTTDEALRLSKHVSTLSSMKKNKAKIAMGRRRAAKKARYAKIVLKTCKSMLRMNQFLINYLKEILKLMYLYASADNRKRIA